MDRNASNDGAEWRVAPAGAHKRGLALIALVCAAALLATAASAARPARRHPTPVPTPQALPADIKVPQYEAGAMPFHDGEKLVYQASWIGILAARARFTLHRDKHDPSMWTAEAWVETTAVVDVLFRMRDYMRESFAADSLETNEIYQRQSENRRFDEYTISFDREKDLVVSKKKNHKGVLTREFIASNPWGPISGAMMALTQALTPGSDYRYDVFSGTNRYVFSFKVDDRERIRTPMGVFDALKITPGVVYLSNGKLRSEASETTIWVSADKRRLPLRMEASAFIGTVTADLVEVDGSDSIASR